MSKGKNDDRGRPVVAVIDDDEAARLSVAQMLRLRSYAAETFSSAEAALAWPGLPDAECAVVDVKMPGLSGEEFLAEMTTKSYMPPVIMITGHGDVSMAVRCLKAGAYDFLEKPFDDDVLLASVARAVEKTALKREGEELRRRLNALSSGGDERCRIIGRSRRMQDVFQQIEVCSRSDFPVLIIGETGSGKELVARAIHSESARRAKPFVAVNAGALPDTMLESELFGHARGAFTGADRDRNGRLVTASGGTLLLDEVESISIRAQIQLLRVLEDGLVFPLGKDRPHKVDVRLIVTTNQNLKELVEQGKIREDFYHRIFALTVTVPPLRKRIEDLPLLVSYFVKQSAGRNGVPVPEIPDKTLGDMMRYSWPGNIRELRHAVERMIITSTDGVMGPFQVDEGFDYSRLLSLPASPGRLRDELERTEKAMIESALRDSRGEINTTCEALGISRRALYERMKKYGLNKSEYKTG